jgi:hypothetical protein
LIRTAITNSLIPIIEQQREDHSFLVSDGGKENNNKQIDQFVSEISEHKLTKIVALKDIQFSNSPVEAIHKIIKGRYIKNKRFESIEGLKRFLDDAVRDYNYQRPHYKHFPKTPSEVYFGTDLKLDIKKQASKAKEEMQTSCPQLKIISETACMYTRQTVKVYITQPTAPLETTDMYTMSTVEIFSKAKVAQTVSDHKDYSAGNRYLYLVIW